MGEKMENNKKTNITQSKNVLEALIAAGERARQEREIVIMRIDSLENYIASNRQDRYEVYEAEEDIRKLDTRIIELNEIIKKGEVAKQAYISNLKAELSEIQDRMDFFYKKIDVCNINMYDDRFSDVESDSCMYTEEYVRLYQESAKLSAEIKKIQKTK